VTSLISPNQKLSMVYQSCIARDGAAPSVVRLILMLQLCIEFDGWFQGGLSEAPLYPLKPGVSRGPPGLSGWPGPLRPPRNSATVNKESLIQ